MPHPIGGNLQAILEECNSPAYQNCNPEWCAFELEMPVPGESHKHVAEDE